MSRRSTGMHQWGAHILRAVAHRLGAAEAAVANVNRVTRFLQGRLEFEPRPTDIYIASYPRSGTTWVQFIVYLLTSDRSVDFTHLSEVCPWWERSLALGTKTAADFADLTAPRRFKSHLLRRWLPPIGRFIYVQRDVQDVALSYYHFYQSHLGFRGTLPDFLKRFEKGNVQYRSWYHHVEEWRRHEVNASVLSVRYEALKSEFSRTVRRIADFLGITVTAQAMDDIRHKASFDFMKSEESRFDPMTESLLDRGWRAGRFLRHGQSGGAAHSDDLAELKPLGAQRRMSSSLQALHLASFLH